jgi:hypothetical protein
LDSSTSVKPLPLRGALTPILLGPLETKVFEERISGGMISRCHVAIHGDDDAELTAEVTFIHFRGERRFAGEVKSDNNPRYRFSAGASAMLLGGPFRSVRIVVRNTLSDCAGAVIEYDARS